MQSDRHALAKTGFLSVNASSLNGTSPEDWLPSLPILPATRLQLELLLRETVVDLRSVTSVILGDPGATLQVLRLIADEFPNEDERPRRIEDCIVCLNLAHCYQVLCAAEGPCSGAHIVEWQHCRRLAECARELARNLEGFSPDEAYLVGLLYRLGGFPKLLGWRTEGSLPGESTSLGVTLARHWNLPECVSRAIREQHELDEPSKWNTIMSLADHLAGQCAA